MKVSELATIANEADRSVRQARRRLEDACLEASCAGMSQRDIATHIDRSQPEVARLSERARRRRGNPSAADYADDITAELAAGDPDFALRLVRSLLDRLRSLPPEHAARFLADRPYVDDIRWDTLIKGGIAWVCRERDIPAPKWTSVMALTPWWFVRPEPALVGRAFQQTPPELAILGVWIDAASLKGL